jgi:hypothetical protein
MFENEVTKGNTYGIKWFGCLLDGAHIQIYINTNHLRCRRGRDRMVVGFKTTYAISAYHH